jgi:ankyrin repeat protein
MAPEIFHQNPSYTNAVDLWSLGCVLYFLLTKCMPFPGLYEFFEYIKKPTGFLENGLRARYVSDAGINFIKGLMVPAASNRTRVSDALNAPWIRSQPQSAQFLLQNGFDVDAVDFDASVALLLAAAKDHKGDIVRLLLWRGANAAVTTRNGWTALHYAADKGHEPAVRLLLERGAEIAAKNNYGCTALHRAAWNGNEAVLRLLLEKGANIAAKTALLWTALHLAADKGHEPAVRLLLERGADVNAETYTGWTALHMAAWSGHGADVQLLLEKKPDVGAKTRLGWTALDRATKRGHRAVVQLLAPLTPHS